MDTTKPKFKDGDMVIPIKLIKANLTKYTNDGLGWVIEMDKWVGIPAKICSSEDEYYFLRNDDGDGYWFHSEQLAHINVDHEDIPKFVKLVNL
jgi:hypothetical protein